MSELKKNANHQQRLAALRLAELQMTDQEDFENCVSDMIRSASLDESEANLVAGAIRSKYLPALAREAGMDEMSVNKMVNLEDGAEETADFANDDEEDTEMELHHFDDETNDEDDLEEDDDEVEDEETATFEIEVPADMVDAAQKAVQKALDDLLGVDMDMEMDDDSDMDDMDDMEDMDDDSEDDMDEEAEEDSEPKMHTSNGVNKMTKQALAARRAEREAILKKIASEEEQYPASAGFKYNEDMVNMPGEVDYPSMTLDASEGNSLKEQNPSYAEQRIPTVNPDSLQFPDITKPSKLDGSGDGSLEYTVDWDSLENPSEGLEDVNLFEVPTQMPSMPHKTTVAMKHAVKCTTCGAESMMTDAELEDETTVCENCENMKKKGGYAEKDAATMTIKQTPTDQVKLMASSDIEKARIKTAFSCSSKLALAGIIDAAEVDAYADQMLNDNLKADAMIRQTKLLLKSAQASSERVAAAAAERMNTRTASTLGISTSPAFNGSSSVNHAALDIQSALKGAFTMPNIED